MNYNKVDYAFSDLDTIGYFAVGVDNVFTKEECENIIKIGKNNFEESLVGDKNKKNKIRKSEHFFMELTEENRWVYERLENIVLEINKSTYNFNLTGFYEPLQLTKYNKGCKYSEHMDSGVKTFLPRKLSIVVQLSDEKKYEGGELELLCGINDNIKAKKQQGSIIVFPSFFVHKVNEITDGTRYSLVSWVGGPQFR